MNILFKENEITFGELRKRLDRLHTEKNFEEEELLQYIQY